MRSIATSTDGWRGLPGHHWAEPHLLAALDHIATSHGLGASVLVGYDGRAGSRELAQLAADLLTTRGISCHLATGPAPTPAVGHLVHHRNNLTAAVVITASHNPPGFTGIKLRDGAGHGIAWPQPPDGATTDPSLLPERDHPSIDVLPPYAASVGHALLEAAARFDGDLVIDTAHGAVGALAPHLPGLTLHRARPLPYFAGHTPDPAQRPHADTLATNLLDELPAPGRALIAMTDGDGDRLALYTQRSGYISSAEQAAALLYAGLPARRLITTTVAPRMAVRTARHAQAEVTETPVGFKHIVTAWQDDPRPSLGLEPNGALVWADNSNAYFERDGLAALASVLNAFPALDALDSALTDLRRQNPHTQLIHSVPHPLDDVLDQLPGLLPGWHADTTGDPALYENGAHGRIAVRASGTEPGTRLYIEAPPETTRHLTTALDHPAGWTGNNRSNGRLK